MNNAIADAVVVEDVNFDSIPDIVATGDEGSQLTIFLGKGDGTFEKTFESGESGLKREVGKGIVISDITTKNCCVDISVGGVTYKFCDLHFPTESVNAICPPPIDH
jgi:hypothetical protein